MEGPFLSQVGPANRYQYNGKEWLPEGDLNLFDYGARMYDPAVARWWVQDPSAEGYYPWTPYNYVVLNPLNTIDPDGRDTFRINSDQQLSVSAGGRDALFISVNTGISLQSVLETPETLLTGHFGNGRYEVGADGNLYQSREFDLEGTKDFIATVIGESSDNVDESQGIGSVMLNSLENNTGDRNNITSNNLNGLPVMYARNPPAAQNAQEQAEIDNRPYLRAMGYSNSRLFDVSNRGNAYRTRVQGALRAIQQGDNTRGATYWEATHFIRTRPNQWHNRQIRAGALMRTTEHGATMFFRTTGAPFVR